MTGSPPDPEHGDNAGSDKSVHQLQVEDELFRHRMALKQHGYQIISTEERLTLTVIQALAQAFLVIAAVAGFSILLGFPTEEALSLLEHGVLVLTGFAFVCIGVFSSSSVTTGWCNPSLIYAKVLRTRQTNSPNWWKNSQTATKTNRLHSPFTTAAVFTGVQEEVIYRAL